jgi:hypothetical protein
MLVQVLLASLTCLALCTHGVQGAGCDVVVEILAIPANATAPVDVRMLALSSDSTDVFTERMAVIMQLPQGPLTVTVQADVVALCQGAVTVASENITDVIDISIAMARRPRYNFTQALPLATLLIDVRCSSSGARPQLSTPTDGACQITRDPDMHVWKVKITQNTYNWLLVATGVLAAGCGVGASVYLYIRKMSRKKRTQKM